MNGMYGFVPVLTSRAKLLGHVAAKNERQICETSTQRGHRNQVWMRRKTGNGAVREESDNGGTRRKNGRSSDDNLAPRVNPNSSLGLKRQLWLVKETARRTSEHTKPAERTRFRKKKEKGKFSSATDVDFEDVRVPKGKYNKKVPPILFVDGYNVIGFWKKLAKKRDRNDMKGAREVLNEEVKRYIGLRGWDCVIVYDAYLSERRGLHVHTDGNTTIVFTGDETADTYIERVTKECVDENTRQVWAATSDFLQQKMTYGNGAHLLSASLLVQEMKHSAREAVQRLNDHNEAMQRDSAGLFKYALSEETRRKLKETFGDEGFHL